MKLAIISDIHGNLEALREVYRDIKKLNIEKIYCLGDLVGYGAMPKEVVQFIRKHKIPTIMGNHEKALFDMNELKTFNPEAKESIEYAKKTLSKNNLDFLKKLPITINFENILLVHGTPPNSFEEYISDLNKTELKDVFKTFDEEICFVGNTHVLKLYCMKKKKIITKENLKRQTTLNKNFKYIVNVGSVGQPREEDSRAKYVIYDTEKNILKIRRINYNIKKTQERIIEAGLPKDNAERLE